ncbi:MAG: GH36-type glycosyl hydrolase domain-containing protein [Anaerolineaceae bacterium]
MRFGKFDDQQREYVISRPDTPLPWINYLGMEAYFGIISNTAGGYSFYKDARLRRLTRYRYNNVPLDVGGRYLYIRDNDAQVPTFWSPTWQPTRTPLDSYECRHGMGYTKIKSEYQGIQSESKYFVPLGENLEIWEFVVTNNRAESANLSLFSAIEFCLWDAVDDTNNYQRNYSIGELEVVDNVIFHKSEYRERRNHFAFFTCSEKMEGFDTQREAFLGSYRGWENPVVVETGQSTQSHIIGWQPIGSQHLKVNLAPGESKKFIFLLGYQENPVEDKFDPQGTQTINKKRVLPVIKKYLQPVEVDKAFKALQSYWVELLDKLNVNTPDSHTNRMVNIWNAYQMMITFNFSRSTSYFETGIGRGMGFRDSNQDLLGFMHLIPERARERIIDLASTQLPTGGAYHQYQPMTKLGNNEVGGNFNDDPQWLVLSVCAYVKETGDWSILDAPVPFDNKPGSEEPLYAHLQRSIKYTADRLGPHGLPLIGRADWNDCLNLNCFSDTPGQSFQTTTSKDGVVAESVFIAGLFCLALDEISALATHLGKRDEVSQYQSLRDKMEKVVETAGWDGDWFRRAYDDFGNPLGSKECKEGQIFIEPQGMCVMAGLGVKNGKAQKALDSVEKRLATKHGIVLLHPAYKQYYLHIGEISSYPPGYKENASVFCHTNPWVMIAETKIGRGDKAFDYYLRINPSVREEISEQHRCEPYVYSQMISGEEAQVKGEAKNSWLTGTAAWNYVAITQHILGIRATYDGLQIAPVIPSDWKGFEAVRKYRNVTYQIKIERQGKGNEVELAVEGKAITGNVIPLPDAGVKEVKVTVTIK